VCAAVTSATRLIVGCVRPLHQPRILLWAACGRHISIARFACFCSTRLIVGPSDIGPHNIFSFGHITNTLEVAGRKLATPSAPKATQCVAGVVAWLMHVEIDSRESR